MIRSRGHCNTMGTASTMALLAEALGTTIPGLAGTPAPDSRLLEGAHDTGRLAVELVAEDRRPSDGAEPRARSSTRSSRWPRSAARPTPSSTCWPSPAGSGSTLTLDDFDRSGAGVPLLVDLQPAGRFLMEDFHRAGGLLAVLREVRDLLDPDRADRHRPAAGRLPRRRPDLGRRGDPRAAPRRCSPTPGSPCCTATSRRPGR